MKPEARNLRDLVDKLKVQFQTAERNLENYERVCTHRFSETVYDPIKHKAYRLPGDPPGTMGVDWRGPMDVPAETIDRWRRECGECGLVQYTQQVKEEREVRRKPKW